MKKNLKSILTLCLTLALVFSLAACGQKAEETPDGAQDDLVVDGPAVDVEQHPVAARLGLSGRGDQPVDADVIGGAVERQQSFRNGIGPDDREAFLQGLPGGEPQDFPRPGKEDEARVRMRERQTGEEFLRTLLFGRGRFQKFEAGGDGGEEVAVSAQGSAVFYGTVQRYSRVGSPFSFHGLLRLPP